MSSPAIRRITQAGVVGALALGVSGVVVMDKSVALSVDGETSTVHSFGGTVADVLDKQGIELGEIESAIATLARGTEPYGTPRGLKAAALLRAEGVELVEEAADLAIAPAGAAERVLCPAVALRPGERPRPRSIGRSLRPYSTR